MCKMDHKGGRRKPRLALLLNALEEVQTSGQFV